MNIELAQVFKDGYFYYDALTLLYTLRELVDGEVYIPHTLAKYLRAQDVIKHKPLDSTVNLDDIDLENYVLVNNEKHAYVAHTGFKDFYIKYTSLIIDALKDSDTI